MDVRARIWIAVFLIAVIAAPAARAERTFDDKDVRGPFDLAALSQNDRRDNELLFALVTHEDWTIEDVKRGGFAIRVDSDPDKDWDRYIIIEWRNAPGPGGKLRARVTLPDGEIIDRQRAHHPRPRRLSVWLDRRVLGIDQGIFTINAYSVYYGDRCPDDGCRDPIPDTGRLKVAFGGLCQSREPDIVGTAEPDVITTRGRRVVVTSLAGNDKIKVERGSAIFCGGTGDDLLVGGGRFDYMNAGPGDDIIRVLGTGRRANQGYGGPGQDLLYGGDDSDQLFGGGGPDYLSGRGGDDFLNGGRGNDDAEGGGGTDTCRSADNLGGC